METKDVQVESKSFFRLNIYSKNDAGWFHLSVFDRKNNSNPPAAPDDITGYHPITTKRTYNIILPDDSICELTPTYTTWRTPAPPHTPARGHWKIEFDITCLDSQLNEHPVTPKYNIMAKGFLDSLIKDNIGNDGFKILLKKDYTSSQDISDMFTANSNAYIDFKIKTGRQ